MSQIFIKYQLPAGWIWTTIDAVTKKVTDGSHNPPKKEDSGIPMLSAKNITNNKISFEDVRYISAEKFIEEYDRANIEPRDILLTIVATIGRCAIVPEALISKFAIQRSVALLKPALIHAEYLLYACQAPFFQKLLENNAQGTAQKGVYLRTLKSLPIPLAPINEQYLIALKIQELLDELEQSVKTLVKAKKELALYKQSFFKRAFSGDLTKNWRKENKKNIENETLKDSSVENLSKIPIEWKWIPIESISKYIGSGSTPKGGRSVYLNEGIPFIRSQNVYPSVLRTNDLVFISADINQKMRRTQIEEKDVLLNITGASIGRCAYVPEGFGQGNVNQHVCIIRIGYAELYHKYLCHYLNSPEAQIHINKINSGATREALTFEQVKKFPIPFCHYDEQILIVQELEYQFTMISNLEETIDNNLNEAELTRLSILKKAYEGKLVPQTREEESADKLITRIFQEKLNYLSVQSELSKIIPKRQKVMNEKLSIIEVLATKKQPMPSSEVWQQSLFNANIDEFYSALKSHIDKNEVTELPRNGRESFLTLVSK
ncbi:MAG TPA: restriction endonuclease subunit S [Mucilaginibacter sp.]|jgi:type I restriction enzyme S subunit|nr:restriction endonuclease subunit S [Mucilaginibacter sp.]